jgi:pimeloyl-ACP methyl ester carboxylesterase
VSVKAGGGCDTVSAACWDAPPRRRLRHRDLTLTAIAPVSLRALTDRYDPDVFELGRRSARLRLVGASADAADVLLDGSSAELAPTTRRRPDALLTADPETWKAIFEDPRGGIDAFRKGRLRIQHDLHLGVGFLAATAPSGIGSLRFRGIRTREGIISIAEAGQGPAVLLVHGLGASKVSFLPTLAALAPHYRAIAVDLPGFGDSSKPIRAAYDPPYFARAMVALLDALEIDRANFVGNSMGGRVALEMGLHHADRVGRLALLAPSLAWLRDRPWAPPLRLVMPQLGLIQPAPRAVVEGIVSRVVPGADEGWTAAGVDEFLRAYLTPRGRSAFYTAARNIYLEEPYGPQGFWTLLPSLQPPSLFVWGERDTLVPMRFARHVRKALPTSQHLELSCGHIPQLERPGETHEAILAFFANRA